MDVEEVRDIIVQALELDLPDVRIVPLGNRVHVYSETDELEIVVRTMNPRGSSRLDRKPLNP